MHRTHFDFTELDSMNTTPAAGNAQAHQGGGEDGDREKILLFDGKNLEDYADWKRWAEAHLLDLDDRITIKTDPNLNQFIINTINVAYVS